MTNKQTEKIAELKAEGLKPYVMRDATEEVLVKLYGRREKVVGINKKGRVRNV